MIIKLKTAIESESEFNFIYLFDNRHDLVTQSLCRRSQVRLLTQVNRFITDLRSFVCLRMCM